MSTSVDTEPFEFEPGQVVVVEGDRRSFLHRAIAWESGWWWTHAFIVVSPTRAVEATFPKVQEFDLQQRLAEYVAANRRVVVLGLRSIVASKQQVAAKARTYVGRWYNVPAVLWFTLFRTFTRTGGNSTFFCSRLVAASYLKGAGIPVVRPADPMYFRQAAMSDGYLTPAELLQFTALAVVGKTDVTGNLAPTY